MRITAVTYPALYRAFDTLSHDCGNGAGHPFYVTNNCWKVFGRGSLIAEIEASLGALSAEDLETLAIGEVKDAEAIAARSAPLTFASMMLRHWFDGNDDYEAEGHGEANDPRAAPGSAEGVGRQGRGA